MGIEGLQGLEVVEIGMQPAEPHFWEELLAVEVVMRLVLAGSGMQAVELQLHFGQELPAVVVVARGWQSRTDIGNGTEAVFPTVQP